MNQKPLPSASPESLGLSSRDILNFIRALEDSGTEMHGLMILRHGKVAAKGWWAPFAPGQIHGSQSLTKTVTGAAYGIAEQEGILSLDEKLVDIFPEYAGETSGPYWDKLKVRHILTMSAGMESMPSVKDADWKREFFQKTIMHEPGTAFFYNSVACSMVGACITKKTGLSLREYLTPRLFDKIGIDADKIRWYQHGDGSQNGSGGICTTTEDNARLMQLYMNDGVWEGEQILSRKWAQTATKLQNDAIRHQDPNAAQDVGYGGMMWIRGNVCYADGAMGQFAAGYREQDMVVSLNQTISDHESDVRVRDLFYHFSEKAHSEPLPEDEEAWEELKRYCSRLALPAPEYAPYSTIVPKIDGRRCALNGGYAAFFADDVDIFNNDYHDSVSAFTFRFVGRLLELTVESESGSHTVFAGMDGRRFTNHVENRIPVTEAVLSAYWKQPDELFLEIRWLQSCRIHYVTFHFEPEGVRIISELKSVGGFDVPKQETFAPWTD